MTDTVEESPSERQENEVEALRAIYDQEFEDLRDRDVWKVRRPPEFNIHLTAINDSKGHRTVPENDEGCTIDLHIKCSDNYPLSAPSVVESINPQNLPDDAVQELNSQLKQLAKDMVGEVMVMNIAQHASAWLEKQNKDLMRRKAETFSSFYEEMEARNKADTERKKARLKREQEMNDIASSLERAAILEEVAKTQEALKEEKMKRKQPLSVEEEVGVSKLGQRSTSRTRLRHTSVNISECSSDHTLYAANEDKFEGVKRLSFLVKGEKVAVERLALIGRNLLGGKVYSGYLPSNGRLVAISEWDFGSTTTGQQQLRSSKKVAFCDEVSKGEQAMWKQISSVEQEMAALQKLSHPNVVQYLGLMHDQANHTLRVFEEFVQGSNFAFYLTENIAIDLPTLRHYASSILEALAFMHSHNFVHRNLRDTSIYLDCHGLVRVGDFSIDKRVRDLWSKSNEAEDKFPLAIGRGGKKVDIYRLGVLLLSFAQGEIVHDPIDTRGLPAEFGDFIRKCLMKDERDRWSADQLLEHVWLQQRVEKSPVAGQDGIEEVNENNESEGPIQAIPFVSVGSGQSRLLSEFSFIDHIGKGGFGEVMKVKNNLDSQVYAIKRIRLNPKNKQLTKKLKREVMLLSRLNHENVVRYYNSWIEKTTISSDKEAEMETSYEESSSAIMDKKDKKVANRLVQPSPVPPLLGDNPDWSFSVSAQYVHENDLDDSSEESYDDEEEEENVFGTSFLPHGDDRAWSDDEDDSEIVFEASDEEDKSKVAEVEEEESCGDSERQVSSERCLSADSKGPRVMEIHYMYIQMEYCDKQTLRSAIDHGLYKDVERVWRMFREIIEGLLHIHSQGMIHRDLKPVNIFIDSTDHVKIGDFGLATTSMIGKADEDIPPEFRDNNKSLGLNEDNDMTGQIGTAMYVAPEINAGKTIAAYSQKVDIFSLGVIFFEMCYCPLQTGMERIKVLSGLRSKDIVLPDDFETMLVQPSYVIRWLLNHDPSQRPTSLELLQSDYLPPPQLEEAELHEMIRHTLSSNKSKTYRHLIDSCISQTMDQKQDVIYDMDLPGGNSIKLFQRQECVRKTIQKVFQRHGAIQVQTPQLLPKGGVNIYQKTDNIVQAMTRSGNVVYLPFDLRVPFARYLARSHISHVRRYCIAPVLREKKMYGLQPKELVECAFDIVSPNEGNLVADAEVLLVADELLRELPAYKDSQYFFRINHISLLQGILLYYGIAEEHHASVYDVIRESDRWSSKHQRTGHLAKLGISDEVEHTLFGMLEREGSPEQLNSALRQLLRRKNDASHMVKKGLSAIERIVSHAHSIGIKCNIVVSPSLVYHPEHFSGMVCQLVYKKKRGYEILAAGGRYDRLITDFASRLNVADSTVAKDQSGVGISICLDILSASVHDDELASTFSAFDVLVYCQVNVPSVVKQMLELASHIWSQGIRCSVSDTFVSIDEAQENAQESGASVLVIFQDLESSVRVRCLTEWERFVERKMAVHEVADFLLRQLKQQQAVEQVESPSYISYQRTDSARQIDKGNGGQIHFDYQFLEKRSLTAKKRLEASINSKVGPMLTCFSSAVTVVVVVVPFGGSVVRTMSAMLDFEDESRLSDSLKDVIDRHPRHKKELQSICDEIWDLKCAKNCPVLVLYSCDDHVFRMVML